MGFSRSLTWATFAIFVFLEACAIQPASGARPSGKYSGCEVCREYSSVYMPQFSIKNYPNQTICFTNTFIKDEDDQTTTNSTLHGLPESKEDPSSIPSCMFCHENGTAVYTAHRVWFEDGRQCSRGAFVRPYFSKESIEKMQRMIKQGSDV